MDLKSPALIYLKGILFLVIGIMCSVWLICLNPELFPTFLLALTIWSFCRAYYFAFYVIEKYVDSRFRFSGLFSFLCYLISAKKASLPHPQETS
jgi:hypothetical protein